MINDLDAPIKEVTVYVDRALITRRGSMHLEAGEHDLRVNNLPQFQFIRESLRAAGKGPQGTRILAVDVTTAFHSQSPMADVHALQQEVEAHQQQYELLKARQDALQDRRQWLKSLGEQSKDFARGIAQGAMKPEDCLDFFGFMAIQSLQDAEAAQKLDIELKQVMQETDAKQRELRQKQGTALPDRQAAVVTVALAEAGDFELEVLYIVTGASWKPQYDARVQINDTQDSDEVELSYIGLVQQATGERWEQVNLSLSTAHPSLAAVLPELKPWYLTTYTPPVPQPRLAVANLGMQRAAQPGWTSSLEEGMPVAASVPPEPVAAIVETASVEHTGTALVFRAGRSVDIPSDNSPYKTTIAFDSLPCTFDYVSAPVVEEHAHLRATISNTTERVLLLGDASIFLGGEYVGTTQVKMTAPNETFKLFLGIDDAIKVKRELIERSIDKGNLLQNDVRRTTYAYRITVHNYAASARDVVIRDHFPVSQHERIKVKILSMQPQPSKHTKLELMTWKFRLPADGEQKIEYRFTVEQPQGMNVLGLP